LPQKENDDRAVWNIFSMLLSSIISDEGPDGLPLFDALGGAGNESLTTAAL
jgi:hypothetical protein